MAEVLNGLFGAETGGHREFAGDSRRSALEKTVDSAAPDNPGTNSRAQIVQVAKDLGNHDACSFGTLVDAYLSGEVPYFVGTELITLADSYIRRQLGTQIPSQKQEGGFTQIYAAQNKIDEKIVADLVAGLIKLVEHKKTSVPYGLSNGTSIYAARVLTENSEVRRLTLSADCSVEGLLGSYRSRHTDYSYAHPVIQTTGGTQQ